MEHILRGFPAEILSSIEIDYCIIGHSERRKYFHETHKDISDKLERLLEEDIIPIFLCWREFRG